MTKPCRPFTVIRPVASSVVHAIGIGPAVRLGPGQNIVFIRGVTHTIDALPLLRERNCQTKGVPEPRLLKRVSVKFADILRDAVARLLPASRGG